MQTIITAQTNRGTHRISLHVAVTGVEGRCDLIHNAGSVGTYCQWPRIAVYRWRKSSISLAADTSRAWIINTTSEFQRIERDPVCAGCLPHDHDYFDIGRRAWPTDQVLMPIWCRSLPTGCHIHCKQRRWLVTDAELFTAGKQSTFGLRSKCSSSSLCEFVNIFVSFNQL